ncbi:MAG: hypothetical protein Q7Q71_02850 [Verrucomicrobiota bacterium JB023]|nr:hypothetical protein [Verrucomicrobiota bacterium JB023]
MEYTSTSPLSFLSLKLGSEDLIHLDEPSAYGEFELALPVDALLIVDAAFTDEGAQALKLEFFPDSRPTRTFSFWGNRRVRENFQPTAND